MGAYVARIEVFIDTPGLGPFTPDRATLDGGPAVWLVDVPTGPYVVADQTVTPLVGTLGDLLDPASAWLDVAEQVASTSLSTASASGCSCRSGHATPRG